MTLPLKRYPLHTAASCPCENMLVAMIEGQLVGEDHDAVHHHLETCQACAALMVEIAHLLAPALHRSTTWHPEHREGKPGF